VSIHEEVMEMYELTISFINVLNKLGFEEEFTDTLTYEDYHLVREVMANKMELDGVDDTSNKEYMDKLVIRAIKFMFDIEPKVSSDESLS
jgi:hypothetical protein